MSLDEVNSTPAGGRRERTALPDLHGPRQERNRLHVTARYYAERCGWHVFPVHWPIDAGCSCRKPDCNRVAKHPRWLKGSLENGLHDATTDVDQIDRWWAKWPEANIGVRTGAVSDLVVVDVDGEEGMRSMTELMTEHGDLDTVWARTGGGGWHAYFVHPGGNLPNNSRTKLGAGLDFRGDGGYVLAPPSLHVSGARYRWATRGAIPQQLPTWLLHMLRPPEPLYRPPPAPPGDGLHDVDAYTRRAVDSEVAAVASAGKGTRNHRLYEAAKSLGGLVLAGVLDEQDVVAWLLIAADRCGLLAEDGERDCGKTIASGLRNAKPRDLSQVRSRAS